MSKRPECTEQLFLKDVSKHRMTVLLDNGVYRHIHFGEPGTGDMHFTLVTYPGFLCYSGDMGSYVFERTPDMFRFFRGEQDGALKINPSYWSEKVEAIDRRSGLTEYRPELFKAEVLEWLDDHKASDEVREAVDDEILGDFDCEHEARQAVRDFEHDDINFDDFQLIDFTDYTFRFIWCCYAIAWGIRQYDLAKAEQLKVPA